MAKHPPRTWSARACTLSCQGGNAEASAPLGRASGAILRFPRALYLKLEGLRLLLAETPLRGREGYQLTDICPQRQPETGSPIPDILGAWPRGGLGATGCPVEAHGRRNALHHNRSKLFERNVRDPVADLGTGGLR